SAHSGGPACRDAARLNKCCRLGVVKKGARSPLTVAAPCGICTQLRVVVGRASVVSRSIAWQDKGAVAGARAAAAGSQGFATPAGLRVRCLFVLRRAQRMARVRTL